LDQRLRHQSYSLRPSEPKTAEELPLGTEYVVVRGIQDVTVLKFVSGGREPIVEALDKGKFETGDGEMHCKDIAAM
jgi:hypothetical protein